MSPELTEVTSCKTQSAVNPSVLVAELFECISNNQYPGTFEIKQHNEVCF